VARIGPEPDIHVSAFQRALRGVTLASLATRRRLIKPTSASTASYPPHAACIQCRADARVRHIGPAGCARQTLALCDTCSTTGTTCVELPANLHITLHTTVRPFCWLPIAARVRCGVPDAPSVACSTSDHRRSFFAAPCRMATSLGHDLWPRGLSAAASALSRDTRSVRAGVCSGRLHPVIVLIV
jgi:hypothetical protein